MIPLVYLLTAWLIFIAIFAIMSFITVIMNLRYGISDTTTYLTTGGFVCISILVLFGVGSFLLTLDWNASLDILPSTTNVLGL